MHFKYRIANFIVDTIVFFVFSLITLLIFREVIEENMLKNILIACYFLYYFATEFFVGKTIGKILTKTKVVQKDSLERPKFHQIIIRTLLRGLPFYFITYFISEKGLHDHLSQTILIKS
ncbi:RDD family protein [Belliella alkalica]|uniref:RDD family protein n=1 Tax=Belliella alkalica TaxID=1730871 RepID=UPI0034E2827D